MHRPYYYIYFLWKVKKKIRKSAKIFALQPLHVHVIVNQKKQEGF